jgi:hypothetical protein
MCLYFIVIEPSPLKVVEKFVAPEELEVPDGMEIVSVLAVMILSDLTVTL